ncbi:MAG: hypothetical protein ACHQF0_11965 [Chitinophagales bacterium]
MQKLYLLFSLLCWIQIISAQQNYEIQVYASPTMTKGSTMFELHSNFTFTGEKNIVEGVNPTYHSLHETLEITQGVTENFEIGFYVFTNYTNPYGYKIIGTHIRPRIRVPEKWNWPVGVSLSTEFGYQRRQYSTDTWNIEIRPIIDKQWDKFYLAFNPTFGISIKSDSNIHTPGFEPNIKASYSFNKLALGIEYYGDVGLINDIPRLSQQSHAIFFVTDLYIDPKWEINFGPGFGLTKNTDGFIFKLIAGRRINWKSQNTSGK